MANRESIERHLRELEGLPNLPRTDELERRIRAGIEQGKAMREKERSRRRRGAWTGIAACLLLVLCVGFIRLSPAFASFVREIPGMEAFVKYIRNSEDRSLVLALEHQYVQPLDLADEYGGVSFRVEGMIADENRALIFYAIEGGSDRRPITADRVEAKSVSGDELGAMTSYGEHGVELEKPFKGTTRGIADIQLTGDRRLPDRIVLEASLRVADPDAPIPNPLSNEPPEAYEPDRPNDHRYRVEIPVDHARFAGMKQSYRLNETIVADGQRIEFVSATVTPLQVLAELKADPANARRVFGAGDIRLVDENGEEWKSFWSRGQLDEGTTIGFESPYLREPKELYLVGSWFWALDKSKLDIVVDTESGQLLRSPDGLKYKGAVPYGDYTKLTFSVTTDRKADPMLYLGIFEHEFRDATGRSFDTASLSGLVGGSTGSEAEGEQESYVYLENGEYKQPLTLRVYRYPDYIRQPFRIRIK